MTDYPYDWRVLAYSFNGREWLLRIENLNFQEGHIDRFCYWRVGAQHMYAGRYDFSRAKEGL